MEVPVGVFEISDQCEKALDVYEDYPHLYDKHELNVNLNGKLVTAMTYIMVTKYGVAPPSKKYFDVISEGYKNCGLDSDYLFEAKEYSIKADSGKGYESARWNRWLSSIKKIILKRRAVRNYCPSFLEISLPEEVPD